MTTQERALRIDELLCAEYGAPFVPFSFRDPLSELVSALLSHRTKNAVTRAAFLRLTETFPTWEEVVAAPTEAVEAAIAAVTYPEVKGPRIQEALRRVKEGNGGALNLDFLAEWPVREARDWLEAIPGVGAKTSAAVLNFSGLRRPALVVDTHHQRVAQRLGIVPARASIDKASKILQEYLPAEWDGQRVYDSHQGFMRHGQRVCHWREPDCERCVVRQLCDFGRKG
ncbi:endonuclease-3 [Lewinella marina]|uniref:Fe-S cluster assembly protein HesB n=1 Tax=Neolewinella marina TaxID=438751 RepID=A0A2G0CIK4_9BACT|nr:Fe-S cluster assembly protein HesB [Neolewinella marina]NJB85039.1 endonuclease-3 [Neolewinella marina]PHK99814.1 Fe-S cluster assembly protein HesB [Neolewinella marina]